jgi:hypothetical protein
MILKAVSSCLRVRHGAHRLHRADPSRPRHACSPVGRKPRRIIPPEQFQALHEAMPDDVMRLLGATDIDSRS